LSLGEYGHRVLKSDIVRMVEIPFWAFGVDLLDFDISHRDHVCDVDS
jgi:hypothetical protein